MKVPVTKSLPHGTIPMQEVRDEKTRKIIMQINENVRSLNERLKTAEAAIRELQGRK